MHRTLSVTNPDASGRPAFNPGWVIPLLVFVLGLFVAGVSGYFATDKEVAQRVTVVETKQDALDKRQDSTEKRLDRIENKIDRLLERVK
jgi:hypothetical protein